MTMARIALLILAVFGLVTLAAPVVDAKTSGPITNTSASLLRRCQKDYDDEELAAIAENGDDGYEPDDCPLLASSLTGPQGHNFCQPGDEDWAMFRAKSGLIYQIKAESPSNYPTEPHLDLIDDGITLAQNDHYFGNDSEIWFWNSGPERPLYVRVTELRGRADCGNSAYTLSLYVFSDKP